MPPAIGTFQAYGEALFTRPHPHGHWVVHGWVLDGDGKPARTRMYDLRDGGRERFVAKLAAEVAAASGASAPEDTFDVDFRRPENGVRGALRYQLRELVDPAKWEYDARAGLIEVIPYKTLTSPAQIPADEIPARVAGYATRYGKWKVHGQRLLDVYVGEFASRSTARLAERFGPDTTHRRDCPCRVYWSWLRGREGPAGGGDGLRPDVVEW